ncbi:PREDICTED: uncharacterized protein LOC109463982 [Branchiostoma belcheri]|uniref:Uncharacterized protein LOC109463982 n=1 Tax=Branchiostoma belcheri TaxID=7741 RepID=A0A6P4Y1U8_BRABE|nr:PREDICTED: uncharacterized protein LOC109463982 [Branchiostoma belcheri]
MGRRYTVRVCRLLPVAVSTHTHPYGGTPPSLPEGPEEVGFSSRDRQWVRRGSEVGTEAVDVAHAVPVQVDEGEVVSRFRLHHATAKLKFHTFNIDHRCIE